MISGTHLIATVLFGVLRPDDDLLYITGTLYDTLLEVIGLAGDGIGSFKESNIGYDQVRLIDGHVDSSGIEGKVTAKTNSLLSSVSVVMISDPPLLWRKSVRWLLLFAIAIQEWFFLSIIVMGSLRR